MSFCAGCVATQASRGHGDFYRAKELSSGAYAVSGANFPGLRPGLLGLKQLKTKPNMPGKGHAYAGIILGGLTFVANLVVILLPFLTR